MPIPPIADKRIPTVSKFCLWECLNSQSQAILRSHARRGWRPPTERFVSINIGTITRADGADGADGGDYRNKLLMSQTPADLYGRQTK
jgi:hypothetical protein